LPLPALVGRGDNADVAGFWRRFADAIVFPRFQKSQKLELYRWRQIAISSRNNVPPLRRFNKAFLVAGLRQ
jgi:hypothetical protein